MSSSQDYPVRRTRRRANLFTNDLKSLMYAFGDVANPDPETVAVLEDILQEYVINMVSVAKRCHEATRAARTANRQKIKVDDFKFALRKDPRKLGRVEELLILQREIAEARRTFDNSEGKSLSKSFVEKDDKEPSAKEKKKEKKGKKEAN